MYDGHGGSNCVEFVKEHLINTILEEPTLPENPKQALLNSFAKIERKFLEKVQQEMASGVLDDDDDKLDPFDNSGVCITLLMMVEKTCFIA